MKWVIRIPIVALQLGAGIKAGRGTIKGRDGPKVRVLQRAAILDLARLWLELTGARPTRRVDSTGQRAGAFRELVYDALPLIWSVRSSVDRLIDEACSQLERESRPVTCLVVWWRDVIGALDDQHSPW